ncbi:MAG TPA: nuclear transport factor 2 family protein [Planctomycetaceae bacterium]|nr:nuclear transport factor 2 family protein [Planctomycetaceae bacterium]
MWFTETPWPPFFICSILSAVFFAQWYLHRRPRQLQLSLAFLALGGIVIIVERLIVTESERVENNVYALAHAFETGDGDRCAEFFSEHDDKERDLVRSVAGQVHVVGTIRITDLTVQMSSAESRATATFRASATVNYQSRQDHIYTRWQLTWQREANEWKIVRIQRLHFVGDGPIDIMSPQE